MLRHYEKRDETSGAVRTWSGYAEEGIGRDQAFRVAAGAALLFAGLLVAWLAGYVP